MLVVVIAMLVILVVAGLVVVYAAYPQRGEEVPAAPWLGRAMNRAADAAPVLGPDEAAEYSPPHQQSYEDVEPRR
ncbi:hypothetical protein [Nocardioides sp.]|uniref:hypothetical protein n=1 Tax=Nocardioides sp. TaxID=35761 RepID=UPI003783037E